MYNSLRYLFFCFILFSYPILRAQSCDCLGNYQWVKETFEQNDAGFSHILEKKGKSAYDVHNKMIVEKLTGVTDYDDCQKILEEWVRFFREDHFRFTKTASAIGKQQAAQLYQPVVSKANLDTTAFKSYLSTKTKDDIEGIWGNENQRILVKKVGGFYEGIVVQSDADAWKEGYVRFKIEEDLQTGTYYQDSFRPVPVSTIDYIGQNVLQIGTSYYERCYPSHPYQQYTKNFYRLKTSGETYGYKKDEHTVYLRIPSFSFNKRNIDSLITHLDKEIRTTPNLIIDLRDCQGGQDNNFQSLIPYLYTNSIRTVVADFYSTSTNNMMWDVLQESPDLDAEEKAYYQQIKDTLNAHLGEFVNIFGQDVMVFKQDSVLPYPKNVGIIIHENNFSTTEEFILNAKQSRKVKFFGRKTGGALDVSNMVEAESPSGDFIFEYCISRSLRVPEMTVDDMGIHPDFYIDRTIPQDGWVDFVDQTMKAWL